MNQPTDHHGDAILAKVRKLLAKAEDPAATEHEAEVYTAKAADLMAAYGIDRALLALSDPSLDVVGDVVITLERPYAADKGELLSGIALALRCSAVRRARYPDGVTKELSIHLFGHRCDLQRTEILFTSLLVQAMNALGRTPVPAADHPAAFRRSWLTGFAQAVHRRLSDSERQAVAQAQDQFEARGTSSTLVLADRSVTVVAARDTTYPHLQQAAPRRLSGSGRDSGWNAGQRADLGQTRLSGPGRAISG